MKTTRQLFVHHALSVQAHDHVDFVRQWIQVIEQPLRVKRTARPGDGNDDSQVESELFSADAAQLRRLFSPASKDPRFGLFAGRNMARGSRRSKLVERLAAGSKKAMTATTYHLSRRPSSAQCARVKLLARRRVCLAPAGWGWVPSTTRFISGVDHSAAQLCARVSRGARGHATAGATGPGSARHAAAGRRAAEGRRGTHPTMGFVGDVGGTPWSGPPRARAFQRGSDLSAPKLTRLV